MSILSANTLFHFTPNFNWLTGILETGFIPRLSKEFYDNNNILGRSVEGTYVPMVCFCDIPVSHLRNHIGFYGQYGIGLDKGWGIEKGLSPVFYLTENSQFIQDFKTIVNGASDLVDDLIFVYKNGRPKTPSDQPSDINITKGDTSSLEYLADQIDNKFMALHSLEKFYKPYSGRFIRGNKVFENYCYYDEREWRYNPTFNNTNDFSLPDYVLESALLNNPNRDDPKYRERVKMFLERKMIEGLKGVDRFVGSFTPNLFSGKVKDEYKEKINNALKRSPRFHLTFDLKNIKYVILKDETEIDTFINQLKELQVTQPEKFSNESINLLATKILTCNQIHEDF